MMDSRIIFLVLCLTTFTSGNNPNPRVREDQVEQGSGSVRSIRDSHLRQNAVAYQPPAFNYHLARQQDHQRQRYAQQQRVDFSNSRKPSPYALGKSLQGRELLSNNQQASQSGKDEEWQPFQPRISKQNPHRRPKAQYIPLTTKSNNKSARPFESNLKTKGGVLGDLQGAGSETVVNEQEIKRQDHSSQNVEGEIIYVHPNQLRQMLSMHSQNDLLSNPNVISEVPKLEYGTLNDLVGKNPNVQLEGLKRLLETTNENSHSFPVIEGPQPFKPKDHTPITEKSVDIPNPMTRPNIKVNHDEHPPIVSSLLKQTTAIDQNSLEIIQKQLDEASNIQAQTFLERANQEARAHVEAQHNAIAEAQKAIFEKVKSSLYESPHGLPIAQQNGPVYAQEAIEQASDFFFPTPLPEQQNSQEILYQNKDITLGTTALPGPLPLDTGNQIPTKNNYNKDVLAPYIPADESLTQDVSLITRPPVHHYPSKNVEYYAPNHLHQATTQLQAEKALIAQVESQNKAILDSIKSGGQEFVNVKHDFQEEHQLADQQIAVDEKETEKVNNIYGKSGKHSGGKDDLQYAARYAFGYRIKDAKAGNDFGHQEKRNGEKAEGSYYVLLPDGRKQSVEYYADTSGYHAKVSYEHLAHHR